MFSCVGEINRGVRDMFLGFHGLCQGMVCDITVHTRYMSQHCCHLFAYSWHMSQHCCRVSVHAGELSLCLPGLYKRGVACVPALLSGVCALSVCVSALLFHGCSCIIYVPACKGKVPAGCGVSCFSGGQRLFRTGICVVCHACLVFYCMP